MEVALRAWLRVTHQRAVCYERGGGVQIARPLVRLLLNPAPGRLTARLNICGGSSGTEWQLFKCIFKCLHPAAACVALQGSMRVEQKSEWNVDAPQHSGHYGLSRLWLSTHRVIDNKRVVSTQHIFQCATKHLCRMCSTRTRTRTVKLQGPRARCVSSVVRSFHLEKAHSRPCRVAESWGALHLFYRTCALSAARRRLMNGQPGPG
jgi:hypothetical protein